MERDADGLQGIWPIWISIHALRMERDVCFSFSYSSQRSISIHALRMERDFAGTSALYGPQHFNPRAPHGARQLSSLSGQFTRLISIHALRMERDCASICLPTRRDNFNPRAPHGARPPNGS